MTLRHVLPAAPAVLRPDREQARVRRDRPRHRRHLARCRAALGLAAAVPATAGDVRSHPNPTRGFTEAVERAARQIAGDSDIAAPGGASILLTHGKRTPRALVLLHGFTDSPRQFAALAESLFASGDNVFVPRLPHHAERSQNVAELARLTASELSRAGDAAIDIAAGLGDSVIVVGLSVGGTMAAWAGASQDLRRTDWLKCFASEWRCAGMPIA